MAVLQTTEVPVGSAGTPSYTFTGDLNTGIYRPAADQVGIAVGGALALLISASLFQYNGNNVAVKNGDGTLTIADGTAATHAVTKQQLDSIAAGYDPKQSVRVATTAAGTLASSFENGDTIDGIVLATGNRILIKNQAAGAENGIYTVNASGAPTRATDADVSSEVTSGMYVFVEEGTTNADSGWVLTNDGAITLGTTALVFVQFTGAGQITAGAALTKTGNTLDVAVDGTTIEVNSDALRATAIMARLNLAQSWSAAQYVATVALTDAANIATNAALGNVFRVVLGGNRTLDNPTNLGNGQTLIWHIKQDATGGRTLAFGSKFEAKGSAVLSTTANAVDILSGTYNSTDDKIYFTLARADSSAIDAGTLDGLDSTAFLRTNGAHTATAGITFSDSTMFLLNFSGLLTTGLKWDTTANQLQFQDAGTTRAYIDLDNGELSATSFVETSDERLKEDITNIDGAKALKQVRKLQGVYFTRKDTKERELGFIAQRVKALEPKLTSEDKDGIMSVSYSRMTALLVEAIKYQQQTIDTMRQELDAMRKGDKSSVRG